MLATALSAVFLFGGEASATNVPTNITKPIWPSGGRDVCAQIEADGLFGAQPSSPDTTYEKYCVVDEDPSVKSTFAYRFGYKIWAYHYVDSYRDLMYLEWTDPITTAEWPRLSSVSTDSTVCAMRPGDPPYQVCVTKTTIRQQAFGAIGGYGVSCGAHSTPASSSTCKCDAGYLAVPESDSQWSAQGACASVVEMSRRAKEQSCPVQLGPKDPSVPTL